MQMVQSVSSPQVNCVGLSVLVAGRRSGQRLIVPRDGYTLSPKTYVKDINGFGNE